VDWADKYGSTITKHKQTVLLRLPNPFVIILPMSSRSPRGRFVTFEGLDGCGKSTQLEKLAVVLRNSGIPVITTREPGGTATGEKIRNVLLDSATAGLSPFAELALMFASRAQHIKEVIQPGLAHGSVVLCDRFTDSTVAYQGYGRGLDLASLRTLDARARDGLFPGLTFLLDCPVAVGLARARGRAGGEDRFERETVAFHERVRNGFLALAAAEPARFCVVDTTEPMVRARARMVAELERRLEGGG